jgi:hypothetical protein
MDIFLVIINAIVLAVVVYLIVDGNKKLYGAIEKTQVEYFESLEKYFQKSSMLLDRSNREFLRVFREVFKKDIPKETPKVLEANQVENSIEKVSGPEEINLTDIPRIPIVDGVKIKFEDEEETFPMNINPIENYQENKSENPIEKS